MARDGLGFAVLGRCHPTFATPHVALLVQGAITVSLILWLGSFGRLSTYFVLVEWTALVFAIAAIFVLRRKMPEAPRPYRTPGYPLVPLVFVLVVSLFLVGIAWSNAARGDWAPVLGLAIRSRAFPPSPCGAASPGARPKRLDEVNRAKAGAISGSLRRSSWGTWPGIRYLSPEARVRRTLEAAAAAAEAVDVEALLSYFSSDYADFMHANRAAFEAMVRESFGRVDRLNATVDTLEVDVEGTEARVTFDAVVVAIRGEERYVVLGIPFQPERLKAHLRRDGGGWKIHRVELPSP